MKILSKAISAICCISLFFSCFGCENISADIPTSSDLEHNNSTGSSLSEDNQTISQPSVEVTGSPLGSEQLAEFSLDYQWAESYVDTYDAGAFLDTLNNNELKTAYCKAVALVHLLSTENIQPTAAIDLKNRAYLLVSEENSPYPKRYMESGYTYDSFMSAYSEVFSDSLLSVMIERGDVFYAYNNELWYLGVSGGGNPGEVHREYELISQSDTEVMFKRIMFSVPIGEEVTDYVPEKRNEYIQTSVDFHFVLTDDGWKADKFLNQQNVEGEIYFI